MQSVKKLSIAVRSSYEVPKVIDKITTEEWEIILSYVSELLLRHDSISSKFDSSELEKELETKYKNIIDELRKQVSEYKDSSNLLASKISSWNAELAVKLQEQKEQLSRQYKQELDQDKKYIMDTYLARLNDRDNTINDLSKQVALLQNKIHHDISAKLQEQKEILSQQYKRDLEDERRSVAERFTSKLENKDSRISELQEYIKSLKSEVESETKNRLALLYSEEKNQLALQLKKLDTQCIEQEKHMNDIEKRYKEHISVLNKSIDDYKSMLSSTKAMADYQEATKSSIEKIQDTLQPVLKYYGGTNIEKGNAGENRISMILHEESRYADAIIEDTSGQSARGDLYFKWKQLKCLIEIKNKKDLTKDDIVKFERDVYESINSSHSINCAMFVSLATNRYPGRGREVLQIEYVHSVPVIYIYLSSDTDIHYAILCLEKLVASRVGDGDQKDKLMKHFTNYYNMVKKLVVYTDKAIKHNEREHKRLAADHNTYIDLLANLDVDYISINPAVADASVSVDGSVVGDGDGDDVDNEDGDGAKVVVDKIYIKKVMLEKLLVDKKMFTMSELARVLDVSSSVFAKHGGYTNILNEVRSEYTDKVLTVDVINGVNVFYGTYGRYPQREYFVKNILGSDLALRKLSRVVGSKKILEYVYEYCAARAEAVGDSKVEVDEPVVEEPVDDKVSKRRVVVRPVDDVPVVDVSTVDDGELDEKVDEPVVKKALRVKRVPRVKKPRADNVDE